MQFRCVTDLTDHLRQTRQAPELEIQADLCPAEMTGDITINCFKFARLLKANPMQVAQEATAWLAEHADVAAVECIKAFVNVSLTGAALFRDTVADEAAILATPLAEADRKRYLVEFSAPNTNKPQHLGHVRNNTLGQATCGVLARAGHDVVPVNLVNDRGIHICKSMLAYQRFGNGETPESAGKKGDHFVGDYYVKYASEAKAQCQALVAADAELAKLDKDVLEARTEIGQAAQTMLRQWEAGDLPVRALWQQMNGWVLAGFAQTYARMGIEFKQVYFESETYRAGKDIVRQGLDKDVFYKREDGAVEIDLTKRKLDKKVVLRSDGTTVYITQDLGTTLMKYEDFKPSGMVWVVGDEQKYHFQVLFAILQDLGYPWAADLHHLAYGMVNLPEGKMKSREGTVVDADNLFDEVAGLAREATLERWADNPPDDLDARAEAIAMGAIKFMLLKVNPKTTMVFNPRESVRFEGDTGPYLMYAYARTCSIFRNAEEKGIALASDIDWSRLGETEERALALRLAGYGDALRTAAADLDPSKVVDYLLSLATEFSRFWKQHSVLNIEDEPLRQARLALCARVQAVLGDGLRSLTIPVLEAM